MATYDKHCELKIQSSEEGKAMGKQRNAVDSRASGRGV